MEPIKRITKEKLEQLTAIGVSDLLVSKVNEIIERVNTFTKPVKPVLVLKIPHGSMESYKLTEKALNERISDDDYYKILISAPSIEIAEFEVLNTNAEAKDIKELGEEIKMILSTIPRPAN